MIKDKDISKLDNLINKLGYKFTDIQLLIQALIHPSLCSSKKHYCCNYEKLELLGDSVLSLIIIELLFEKYPKLSEGDISKRKANLVCTQALSEIGSEIGLGKYIFMTKGEEKLQGRTNPKNIENVVESVIGAMYLDGGLDVVKKFVRTYWSTKIEEQKIITLNPKSRLQEWAQQHDYAIPTYRVVEEKGDKSNPIFIMDVEVGDFPRLQGEGNTKKEAEIKCATNLIEYIKTNIDNKI